MRKEKDEPMSGRPRHRVAHPSRNQRIKACCPFVAARCARLPLHGEEPPPLMSRRKAVAKVAAAPPLVTFMPDQVGTTHSWVKYGASGWFCVVCRKAALSSTAAHGLARTRCCTSFLSSASVNVCGLLVMVLIMLPVAFFASTN